MLLGILVVVVVTRIVGLLLHGIAEMGRRQAQPVERRVVRRVVVRGPVEWM